MIRRELWKILLTILKKKNTTFGAKIISCKAVNINPYRFLKYGTFITRM